MRGYGCIFVGILCFAAGSCFAADVDFFPAVTQFSPAPSGEGWKGEEGPLSEDVLRATVDDIAAHGFTGIELPTRRPAEEEAVIIEYARSKGMVFSYLSGGFELFGRDAPIAPSVYAPEYAAAVRANAEKALADIAAIPNLYNAFIYQDEPFHGGPASFGNDDAVKAEFAKRYGYPLPEDAEAARGDARVWRDLLNFRSGEYPDGWRQVYGVVKELAPNLMTVLTHDSHNTFGGGCGSNAQWAVDDVFHWGGDFSDMFVYDIYPYMMFDFRFGEPGKLPKPRMSQTHYSFAQMRGLTTAYGKQLGFWVGTYNPAWFAPYLCPELAAMHWAESETCTTAVAQGADYLLTGYKIPTDAAHWESLGKGLQLIQKTGGRLLGAPKVKAKAAMLFPRTQYLQLQQEYFNAGLSFELFLRAFGELDMLHEDQVTDDALLGYDALVLFDVELLPEAVARHIANFVRNGGILIADCVPSRNEFKEPMPILEEIFGVKDAQTGRIPRSGHWVPSVANPPEWACRAETAPDENVFASDRFDGKALGVDLGLTLISPRTCTLTDGQTVAAAASGMPALVRKANDKGQAFLLGFCLQDTYFGAIAKNDAAACTQLRDLLSAIAREAGLHAHVHSSNPDIEAAVRANDREGFLFVINHEAQAPAATVRIGDLPFQIGDIVNLATGEPLAFAPDGDNAVWLDVSVPVGETLLAELKPAPPRDSFTLWQLPNQTRTQMMSYVLQTVHGKVIVIDGGNAGDAPYLARFLEGLGNQVEAWFISHAHDDHFDAIAEILKNPGALEIKAFYGSLPTEEWVAQNSPSDEGPAYNYFNRVLEKAGRTVSEVTLGQTFDSDGVHIEVLGVKNPEITRNAINNSSMVLRVSDAAKSVLFTADLGAEGGAKLLGSPYADKLPSDYVQMAHHGQNGVREEFYQKANPKYCLWPTPVWLWNNDGGGGVGTGHWRTLEVRAWIEKLPVKKHYLEWQGLQMIQ